MVENKERKKKKKEHRFAQYLGMVLVVFSLGMFIGYACNYQDVVANFFTGQNTDRTHIIHNSSKMAEQGARVGYYVLGTTENDKYNIEFDDELKQKEPGYYSIEGNFTNNSDKHFTTVELNFSLLDKDGNKVGDIYAYCDGLNANQVWKFTAINSEIFKTDVNATSAILDNVIYTLS